MKTTRVLIADPYPVLRQALATLVREQGSGWQVCGLCGPGPAVVEMAEELRPDLLILSHGHAGCDGLVTARAIGARSRRTSVLLFSEAPSGHDLHLVASSGIAGALLKSDEIDELRLALEVMRRRARYRSRALLRASKPPGAGRTRPPVLTARELENLRLIARGHSIKEIAAHLGVSKNTSQTHRKKLYKKFGVHSAVELTRAALRIGLVKL